MDKFPKEVSEYFRIKSSRNNKNSELIQIEPSNLFVSPSKLFKGKEIPKVSDSKKDQKIFFEEKKPSELFFNFGNEKESQVPNHSTQTFRDLSTPKESSLLGKRPFTSLNSDPIEDSVTKKISTSSFFLKKSPVSLNKKFTEDKKQGKERIPSRKASPKKISKIIKRSKIKREEPENDSSLLSTMNTNLDYRIKFEGGELPKIRKKVCRKLYEIFSNKYNLGKKEAKHLALNLEYRMDTTFNHEMDSKIYRKNFKVLLKHLDVFHFFLIFFLGL